MPRRLRGYPAYDFLTFASSIRLAPASLRRELRVYCGALGCEPPQVRHHLVAALGALSLALGEWPAERFAATAHSFLELLEAAQ